jgi:hypothetical protein
MPKQTFHRLPSEPDVTIVLPVFNAERFITDAVRSIRSSTYQRWRCIVVDDGSTDATVPRARGAAGDDARFLFVHQPNEGHIGALNHAASVIRDGLGGDLVALLDNDDLFLPTKLERVVALAHERPRAGLVVHRLYVADERLRIAGVTPLAATLPDGDLQPQLKGSRTGDPRLGVTSGMILRREVFDRIFPAPASIGRFPDELVRRIAPLAADVASCDEPLGVRRVHGGNQSDDSRQGLRASVGRSLASYRRIASLQERRAHQLGVDLPEDDLDLEVMGTLVARLDGAPDATARRRWLIASKPFRAMGIARRLCWRVVLSAPTVLLRPLLRQAYGVSNAKLVLNRVALARLRRQGLIRGCLPYPLLPWGRLLLLAAGRVHRHESNAADAPMVRALPPS